MGGSVLSRSDAPWVLAVDAGTTEVRATILDTAGQARARSARSYTPRFPAPGRVEIDPLLLWSSLAAAVRNLEPDLASVAAVCVAGELGTLFLDAAGRPLGTALCWPDKRARAEADWLRAHLGADAVYRTTGRIVDPELPAAKLLWLRRHDAERAAHVCTLLSIKDFLVHRLTGKLVTDETHAAYSMLFDVHRRRWADDLVRELQVRPSLLPDVLPAAAVAGRVTPDAATDTGLRPGTPVATGGPDGTVGAVGAGLVRPGVTVDLAGTADVVFHTTSSPLPDPGRRAVLNAHLVPGLWALGGPTGTTGGMVAKLAETLGYDTAGDGFAAFDRDAAGVAAGADGLVCCTALAGERFPDWHPAARGVLFGLRLDHTRAHIARAALEGAALILRSALQVYGDLGLQVDEVRLVGGGARSAVWTQVRADLCGIPMVQMRSEQATTLGAAALAAVTAGAFSTIEAAADALAAPGPRIEPNPESAQAYTDLFQAYRRLREELGPAFDVWDELQDPTRGR